MMKTQKPFNLAAPTSQRCRGCFYFSPPLLKLGHCSKHGQSRNGREWCHEWKSRLTERKAADPVVIPVRTPAIPSDALAAKQAAQAAAEYIPPAPQPRNEYRHAIDRLKAVGRAKVIKQGDYEVVLLDGTSVTPAVMIEAARRL